MSGQTYLRDVTARIIGDLRAIANLVDLIDHEMEKRIVARHFAVKLDALSKVLPRYKNELKATLGGAAVRDLEARIKAFRNDYEGSSLEHGRDGLAAHSLKLDLIQAAKIWTFLGRSIFAILLDDFDKIEAEIIKLDSAYAPERPAPLPHTLKAAWAAHLGSLADYRYACIYPGIATAGIVTVIPTNSAVQDALVRVAGLMTFLRQVVYIMDPLPRGSREERLLAELLVNDYFALWEALFNSGVNNSLGAQDPCLLDLWTANGAPGVAALQALKANPHPDLETWRQDVRNKIAAHTDPTVDPTVTDIAGWPMTIDDLVDEVQRIVSAVATTGQSDITARMLLIPPRKVNGVVGLGGQDGKHWNDS